MWSPSEKIYKSGCLNRPRGHTQEDEYYTKIQIWLMIGQKTAKCDMRVLRVPVTWFYVGFF